ncbi:MAG: hypothetical protein M3Y42_01170 [Actinomycetota bacterium]|nr:hypothetical protein [Actinomycetota bacterium]MDQ2955560.1 hypothetical protein [Actinomycetota bacterium]
MGWNKHRSVSLFAVALLASTTLATLTSAQAAVAPALTGSCPTGTETLMPTSITALTGGGYSYHYRVNGLPQTQTVAPSSFRPATASDSTLREYDYPPRPASGTTDDTQWLDHARTYRGTRASTMCRSNHLISSPTRPVTASTSGTNLGSPNWSGMVAAQTASVEANRPFKFVQGQWVQTGYLNCNCSEPTDESTWAGMGGFQPNSTGQDGLIQDGTDMFSTDQPNSWWEYLYPCPGSTSECGVSEQTASTVSIGDTIFAETYWDGSAAHFLVEDNGFVLISHTVTLPTSAWDGRNAEWINERPGQSTGGYDPLTNYGVQHWSNASACPTATVGGTCYTAGQLSSNYLEMETNSQLNPETCSSAAVLAYPSGLSGGSFSSNWCRAQ